MTELVWIQRKQVRMEGGRRVSPATMCIAAGAMNLSPHTQHRQCHIQCAVPLYWLSIHITLSNTEFASSLHLDLLSFTAWCPSVLNSTHTFCGIGWRTQLLLWLKGYKQNKSPENITCFFMKMFFILCNNGLHCINGLYKWRLFF